MSILKLSGFMMGIAAVLVTIAIVVARYPQTLSNSSERPTKKFTRTLAEGVTISQHGMPGIKFVELKAAKISKRKLGMFSLGGMNVLKLEDLKVVLPAEVGAGDNSASEEVPGSKPRNEAERILHSFGINSDTLRGYAGKLRFSGLEIDGLQVSSLDARTNVVPRFSAKKGELSAEGLELSGCKMFDQGSTNIVNSAIVQHKPSLRLVWRGGEMKLP